MAIYLLKKYKAWRRAKVEAEKKTLEAEKAECEAEYAAELASMLSSPCAVNGGKVCFKECVHFNSGREPFEMERINGEPMYVYRRPSCKLWGW